MYTIRAFEEKDLPEMTQIWNDVVLEGRAFPQVQPLTLDQARQFFGEQSYTGVAADSETGAIAGLYILHPNNIGRCGHISNASYAVKPDLQGKHIGQQLVRDCMAQAKALGFRILQFNAVVASNAPALHLYKTLGFTQLGVIPGGFCNADGVYEDIIVHYITL